MVIKLILQFSRGHLNLISKSSLAMEYCSDSNDSSQDQKACSSVQKKMMYKKEKVLRKSKRGTRESKRFWKEDRKRFSSLIEKPKCLTSWENKEKLRLERKNMKEVSRSIVAERALQKQLKKERRIANLKRKEENAKKAEVVQMIKNSAKLKKMKRKQLRRVEKRDVLPV